MSIDFDKHNEHIYIYIYINVAIPGNITRVFK